MFNRFAWKLLFLGIYTLGIYGVGAAQGIGLMQGIPAPLQPIANALIRHD